MQKNLDSKQSIKEGMAKQSYMSFIHDRSRRPEHPSIFAKITPSLKWIQLLSCLALILAIFQISTKCGGKQGYNLERRREINAALRDFDRTFERSAIGEFFKMHLYNHIL